MTATGKFGASQSEIDVTEQFNEDVFQSSGIVLPDDYLIENGLEDVTLDDVWQRRYVGDGYRLGLFRDSDDCYWEAIFNEAQKSITLRYLNKKADILRLVADYSVRVWDKGFSAEWLVIDDEAVIITSGGVPEAVINDATDVLIEKVRLHPNNLKIVQEYVACQFVGDDENTDSDEDHTPNCQIEDLR